MNMEPMNPVRMKQHLLPACLALFAAFGSLVTPAHSQTFPSRPVKLIAPFPPGGPVDTLSRIVGEKFQQRTGQPVVVDNRPGGAGNIGIDMVAKAAPDGYSWLFVPQGNITINATLIPNMPFNWERDFAPVTLIAYAPNMLAVNPSVPAKTTQELIAYAKANPGKLNFSSDGVGTNTHVALEHLKKAAGIDVAHIPYPGSAAQTAALLGGQIDFSYQLMPAPLPMIRAGKLRGIASAAPMRLDPDKTLMTVAEQGYPGFDIRVWYGIVTTAGTPAVIVDRLSKELAAIMNDADVIERLKPFGHERVGSTPGELANIIKEENAVWKRIVEELKLKLAD